MLFRAEEPIAPNAQLEINLVLPAEIAGLASAEVVCRGEVVRTVEGDEASPSARTGSENPAVPLPARLSPVRGVSPVAGTTTSAKASALRHVGRASSPVRASAARLLPLE